jgi:hypothetical protein
VAEGVGKVAVEEEERDFQARVVVPAVALSPDMQVDPGAVDPVDPVAQPGVRCSLISEFRGLALEQPVLVAVEEEERVGLTVPFLYLGVVLEVAGEVPTA